MKYNYTDEVQHIIQRQEMFFSGQMNRYLVLQSRLSQQSTLVERCYKDNHDIQNPFSNLTQILQALLVQIGIIASIHQTR